MAAGRSRSRGGLDLAAGLSALPMVKSRAASIGGDDAGALLDVQAFTRLQDMLDTSKGPLTKSCFARSASLLGPAQFVCNTAIELNFRFCHLTGLTYISSFGPGFYIFAYLSPTPDLCRLPYLFVLCVLFLASLPWR